MKEIIEKKLIQEFTPDFIEIINNSHLHQGHFKPLDPNHVNQTHFLIKISSKKFTNLTRIAIHRNINNLLKDEFDNGLHALEIKII